MRTDRIGINISKLRIERGITQEQLGRDIGLTASAISNIECGRSVPSVDTLCRFSESSPNLCVNSSFSYVVLSTLLLSSRDLTEWSLVYHSTLSYQRFYDLHSIHYDHLEGLHQLI